MPGLNLFDAEALVKKREHSRIGNKIFVLESCESSNAVALDLVKKQALDGTVVLALNQTKGKGRLNRSWAFWPGNLAISIIVKSDLAFSKAPRLLNASTLATINTLHFLGIEAKVKWPNDILTIAKDKTLVSRLGPFRKVGGILIELVSTNNSIDAAVIGVGLNLCNPPKGYKQALPQMGFLEDFSDQVTFSSVLENLLEAFEQTLAKTNNDLSYQSVIREIKSHSCLLGKIVKVECGENEVEGKALDIDEDGSLIVQSENGSIKKIFYGDVHIKEFS